ncbi:MAG: MFS transporter, partial [Chloroflexi bacterium]|nr:MFS transporter [Chloroflexota bacterium]
MATIARANTPLSALRHFNFRLYFIGQLISLSGTWMQRVAQGWLVFQLTGSEFALGLVAAAQGFPMLLLIPLGGVVSDRYSRRTILIMSFTVQMLQAILLAILTFAELVEVWHIVALSAALGVATAFEMPARQTFVYDLVGRVDIQSGVALNAITINAANILGPTAAGILLVQIGAAWCFSLNGVTFLASLGALAWMQLAPFSRQMTSTNPWAELVDGLRYAIRHPTIAPLLILGTSNAVFGINVLVTLLPSFADVTLD